MAVRIVAQEGACQITTRWKICWCKRERSHLATARGTCPGGAHGALRLARLTGRDGDRVLRQITMRSIAARCCFTVGAEPGCVRM